MFVSHPHKPNYVQRHPKNRFQQILFFRVSNFITHKFYTGQKLKYISNDTKLTDDVIVIITQK